jgi:hypothetical protein
MVRLTPGGNIPAIRLQGRSLDMMDAGTPASKPLEQYRRPKPSAADGEGRIGNDAAFSMSYVQMRVRAGDVPINGTELARLRQAQQASTSGAWLDELH